MKNKIYLDNSATSKPKKEVLETAIDVMKNNWLNPNSIYERGFESRKIIENVREIVAKKINAEPEEIIFCPSASAANTLAIKGYCEKNNQKEFSISKIEHSSIFDVEIKGIKKNFIGCNSDGIINSVELYNIKNQLVSISAANSEIGTVQNIDILSNILHKNGCVFHSDLTQYIPYFNVDVKSMGVDMATFSAHKFGGLRGCGVLYVRKGIELSPLVFGHQENGLVGGTENVISIASMGKAIEMLDYSKVNNLVGLRNYAMEKILKIDKNIFINGNLFNRIPCNINITIPNINITSQQIVNICDENGFEISAGSACNAYSPTPSHVLKAIGLNNYDANRSVRITLSENNTFEEIDKFIFCLKTIISMNS